MTRARSPLLRRALVLSLLAHGSLLLLGSLMVRARLGSDGPPQGATAEMIFVDPGNGRSGAEAAPPSPAPAPPQAASTAPASVASPDALPAEIAASTPAARPPPDAAAPSAPAPAAAAPVIRLKDGEGAGSTSEVETNDIPAGPDPAAPNIPPRYPPDAARRGEEGVVVLEVAVAADGDATGVGVYVSSGFERLDRAARDAVARWRFTPKLDGGLPTSSRTLIRVRFRLD